MQIVAFVQTGGCISAEYFTSEKQNLGFFPLINLSVWGLNNNEKYKPSLWPQEI